MKLEKPPYSVPPMAAISRTPRNGYRVISTFSGCGGSGLGYRMAGFDVVWANEFIEPARETYLANWPDALVDARDIRAVKPQEILEATGLRVGELDILDGSPPCAAFSTAGKRSESWSKVRSYSETQQRSDDLFFEYARILAGLKPRTFVAENVSGLVKGVAKGYFKEIYKTLEACGYRIAARVLDAQWLGVPQARQRLIFIGVRKDLNVEPVHPRPLPYRYSVREALPHIKRVEINRSFTPDCSSAQPSPTIVQGGNVSARQSPYMLVEAETDISRYAIGKEWDKLVPGEQSERYFSLTKPSLGKPCPALTIGVAATSGASVVHPTEKRKFSIAELKQICAFPEDFILTGTYSQQWERLGRAVPPVMMQAIAATVRDQILARVDGHPV